MDEARFVFEFVDRGGNPRAPGGGAPQSGGQGSDTAGKYWEAQGGAGGAGGLAFENSQKFGRNHPGVSTPATVPGSQASKPSDTRKLSDTVTEIGGIVGQASGALKGLPTGPSDLLNRGKSLADAANRALGLADRMFLSKPAQAMSVPPVDARVRDIDIMSPTAKAKAVADDIFAKAKEGAAKRGAAGDIDPADAARQAAKDFARGASKQKTVVAEVVDDAVKAGGAAANAGRMGAQVAGAAGRAGASAGAASVGGTGAAGAAGLGAGMSTAAIGGVAALAAIPTLAYVASAKTANDRMGEIAGGQAGQFSGDVVRALAQAEVRQIRADMRTANRVGDIVADNVTQNSRLSESTQRIKDAFVQAFGSEVNSIMRTLADIAEGVAGAAEEAAGVKKTIDEQFPTATSILDKIRREQERQEAMGFFDWFRAQPHIAPEGAEFDADASVKDVRFQPIPGLML